MRARVLFPIVGAALCAAAVLGLVWWQITDAQNKLRADLINKPLPDTPIDQLDRTVEVEDTGDQVLLHLRQGDVLSLQGDWAAAEVEYKAAVDLDGGLPALRKLAQAQLQRRDMKGAAESIDRLKASGARGEDILLLEVIVALRSGEVVRAKELLSGALDSPQKHYGLGLLAVIQGDHENVKKEFNLVLAGWDPTLRAYARTFLAAYDEFALFPESRPIHLQTLLARALAQVQECELALPLLAQVVAEQNDYRDAWTVQGFCELTTERKQEALASFTKAYELDPEKPEIQYFLGRTYLALQDWKNAETFLSYALQNGFVPAKEVRKHLVRAALGTENVALALDQLKSLITEADADIETFSQAVTLLIQLGQPQEALSVSEKAVEKWPTSARTYDLRGWTKIELGKTDEAKIDLEQALKIDPTLQSARERYGKL